MATTSGHLRLVGIAGRMFAQFVFPGKRLRRVFVSAKKFAYPPIVVRLPSITAIPKSSYLHDGILVHLLSAGVKEYIAWPWEKYAVEPWVTLVPFCAEKCKGADSPSLHVSLIGMVAVPNGAIWKTKQDNQRI